MKRIILLLAGGLFAAGLVRAETTSVLETITVTATQEEARLADTAASVGVLSGAAIAEANPIHAADIVNRIAGVNIVQLGSTGSGVAAAIRQPVSYSPVYLYLENNVPTRSAAFFNHNALYEVNTSQSDSIEVLKGPGSALYGSEAIGGVINVINGAPAEASYGQLNLELGEYGFQRLQAKAANVGEEDTFGARLEWLSSDGWRKHTGYEKLNAVLSWATDIGAFDVNTVLTGNAIDNESGGSGLSFEDYMNAPKTAGNLVGYRDVSALRLVREWRTKVADGELKLTPFARHNRLEYLATWTLNTGREVCRPWFTPTCQLDSQDAHINESGHDSLGLNAKFKQDFNNAEGFWIVGLDTDFSRGNTLQTYIIRTDSDAGNYWLAYEKQHALYDYQVDFVSVSPYVHTEVQLVPGVRLSAGLRHDWMEYDYHTRLEPIDDPASIHKRPQDTVIKQSHTSPKLGVTWDVNAQLNVYAAYRHAFRIATESQLFRSGRTVNSTALDPVKADSLEIGVRGILSERVNIEAGVYHMILRDEILSESDETGARHYSNAGKTRHQGIELAVSANISDAWETGFAGTFAHHSYVNWVDGSYDYSGNRQVMAPELTTNLWLAWRPQVLNGGRVEVNGAT